MLAALRTVYNNSTICLVLTLGLVLDTRQATGEVLRFSLFEQR
jgi:hypothetical protein